MTAFFIEDHAVQRYIKRIRKCSAEEARQYLEREAPAAAPMKERTLCGDPMRRLPDCLLVIKRRGDGQPGLAVATVLGPREDCSVAAAGGEEVIEQDEQAQLNKLADASRGTPWRKKKRNK